MLNQNAWHLSTWHGIAITSSERFRFENYIVHELILFSIQFCVLYFLLILNNGHLSWNRERPSSSFNKNDFIVFSLHLTMYIDGGREKRVVNVFNTRKFAFIDRINSYSWYFSMTRKRHYKQKVSTIQKIYVKQQKREANRREWILSGLSHSATHSTARYDWISSLKSDELPLIPAPPLAAVSVSLLLCEKMNDRKNRLWNWSRIFSHSFFFFLPPVHTSNRRLSSSRSNFHLLFSSMGLHAQLFHTDCSAPGGEVKWSDFSTTMKSGCDELTLHNNSNNPSERMNNEE